MRQPRLRGQWWHVLGTVLVLVAINSVLSTLFIGWVLLPQSHRSEDVLWLLGHLGVGLAAALAASYIYAWWPFRADG